MSPTESAAAGVADSSAPRRARPWLRAAVVAAALAFLALLAFGVATKSPDRTIDDALASGEAAAAPGFELPVLQPGDPGAQLGPAVQRAASDGAVSLEELRGSPVVLNFWASWCDPCRAEAGVLEDGWRAGRDRGILFLGLNMQDLTGDARGFIDEFGTTYPNVRDESNAVALDWGVTGLPETFFLSARGEVVGHAIGALSSRQLELGVRAAEQGRPLGSIEAGARRSVE